MSDTHPPPTRGRRRQVSWGQGGRCRVGSRFFLQRFGSHGILVLVHPFYRQIKLGCGYNKRVWPSSEEIHSFIIGFCECFLRTQPRFPGLSDELQKWINSEYHYYLTGRCAGYAFRIIFYIAMFSWIGHVAKRLTLP